ncbi:hypothetical protein ACFOY4_40930 [Actinomadura syzygii]|uniref:hypothetical protein n=1 Tax=Actinomadura syzygii TaxID=1427538 RepID=UPI003619DEB4
MSRTLLHVATDWPGHYPNGPQSPGVLVAAGTPVNGRFAGPHSETALHWAASSDDVPVLDALLDAGADNEADGAVIGGRDAAGRCGGVPELERRPPPGGTRCHRDTVAGRRAR